MRVLVAMSGGVDSSVAAALLRDEGHDVVGATLKLWGGASDSGCCSVADVDDARRVAQQLGIDHHVFNMAEEFEAAVIAPYVAAHAAGRTPNPCIECNRHIKFDRLLARAERLGFDALATGHHARIDPPAPTHGTPGGVDHNMGTRDAPSPQGYRLCRGADRDKDQSYVLSMLGQDQLARLILPVGALTKREVRAHAAAAGLRTAGKPDSQDVCFIHSDAGRKGFLAGRLDLHRGDVVDTDGAVVGEVDAVELVTVGQRRGMGHGPGGRRRYVLAVDVRTQRVTVGDQHQATARSIELVGGSLTWVHRPLPDGATALAQVSAHGTPARCVLTLDRGNGGLGARSGDDLGIGDPAVIPAGADGAIAATLRFDDPLRPVAPGQTVALYDPAAPDVVVGAGIAA